MFIQLFWDEIKTFGLNFAQKLGPTKLLDNFNCTISNHNADALLNAMHSQCISTCVHSVSRAAR